MGLDTPIDKDCNYDVEWKAVKGVVFLGVGVVVVILSVFFLVNREKRSEFTGSGKLEGQERVIEEVGKMLAGAPDFPVYPGADVKKSFRKEKSEGIEYLLIWEVNAPVVEVMKWYGEMLRTAGWDVEGPDLPESDQEQNARLTKNDLVVNLLVRIDDDGEERMTIISAEFVSL